MKKANVQKETDILKEANVQKETDILKEAYALKGQYPLAQGNALGTYGIGYRPERAKALFIGM